jgi:hypothetical protein
MRKKGNVYRILVGKPDGKRPLGRPGRRWKYNIKMDIRKMVWFGLDSSGSGCELVEGSCEHGNEHCFHKIFGNS